MRFKTKSLGPVGVEVTNVDIRDELLEDDLATLRGLVLEEGLVLFREQPLGGRSQIELGRRFGALERLSLDGESFDEKSIVLANVDENGQNLSEDDQKMRMPRSPRTGIRTAHFERSRPRFPCSPP